MPGGEKCYNRDDQSEGRNAGSTMITVNKYTTYNQTNGDTESNRTAKTESVLTTVRKVYHTSTATKR
jgi:hypothetical protein